MSIIRRAAPPAGPDAELLALLAAAGALPLDHRPDRLHARIRLASDPGEIPAPPAVAALCRGLASTRTRNWPNGCCLRARTSRTSARRRRAACGAPGSDGARRGRAVTRGDRPASTEERGRLRRPLRVRLAGARPLRLAFRPSAGSRDSWSLAHRWGAAMSYRQAKARFRTPLALRWLPRWRRGRAGRCRSRAVSVAGGGGWVARRLREAADQDVELVDGDVLVRRRRRPGRAARMPAIVARRSSRRRHDARRGTRRARRPARRA